MNELLLVPPEYDIAWFVCDVPSPVSVGSHKKSLVREYWDPPSYEAAMSSVACVNYISVYQVYSIIVCPLSVLVINQSEIAKALISFLMSVRPHRTTPLPLDGFSLNFIFQNFFRKAVETIKVSLKSDKNNGYLTLRPPYIYDHISLSSS